MSDAIKKLKNIVTTLEEEAENIDHDITVSVQKLYAIDGSDYKRAHIKADEILLKSVHADIATAYRDLVNRSRGWHTA